MSQQSSGTPKQKGGVPYSIERRTQKKRGSGSLSGYALDITIRVNSGEAYFLQDHNADRVMPHNNRKELADTIMRELERNHIEFFGHP